MTTADEARKMFRAQTYKFKAHSGVEYELKKPGPTLQMDVVTSSGMPTKMNPTEEEKQEAGMLMYQNRESIYHAVLPDYIVDPKVVDGPGGTALTLDEIPDDDKWGIVQDLMTRAAGEVGAEKATTFPDRNTGAVARPDGEADEPAGK